MQQFFKNIFVIISGYIKIINYFFFQEYTTRQNNKKLLHQYTLLNTVHEEEMKLKK